MRWSGRFEGYSFSAFRNDLISGLIVGVIAIPLGMAFAIASGVKPEYGIYTTITAGIIISLFGGSRFQIGGPTGAFVPILLGIVLQYGYESLLIAGFMAGVMLVIMGLLKVGGLIKFIPRPVTIGFTSGIAVLIFTGQITNFLGLDGVERHEDFVANMKEMTAQLYTINWYSVATAGISLAVILAAARYMPKIPGALLGLIVSTAIAGIWFQGDIATIGTAYGAIPGGLPQLHIPDVTWERLQTLMLPALIIAMLGGIESLLSAVVADNMTGTSHNSNRELIGQGIANIVTPLFGGIPATGAIARTAANIKSGAESPLSGVIHGVFVLLVLLLLAPYASYIPLASMAPILMIVAWNMSEKSSFIHILKTRTSDTIVLLLTFGLTVFANLTVAVVAGLIASVVLFAKAMGESMTMTKVLPDRTQKHQKVNASAVTEHSDCPQLVIYTIDGPLFFGGVSSFKKPLQEIVEQRPRVLLLRMGKVPLMDTTGEAILSGIVRYCKLYGGKVLISGLQPQPLKVMKNTGLYARIGADNIYPHTGEAIQAGIEQLDFNHCVGCKQFAFHECAKLSAGRHENAAERG